MKSVSDICDEHSGRIRVVQKRFSSYGKFQSCHGFVVTAKIDTDNSCIIEQLRNDGKGKVLAIVASDQQYSAIVGDRLAKIAIDNHWSGILVNGAVRDVATLAQLEICIQASAVYPVRGHQSGGGSIGVPITIGNTAVCDGDYIYIDADGIVLTESKLEGT